MSLNLVVFSSSWTWRPLNNRTPHDFNCCEYNFIKFVWSLVRMIPFMCLSTFSCYAGCKGRNRETAVARFDMLLAPTRRPWTFLPRSHSKISERYVPTTAEEWIGTSANLTDNSRRRGQKNPNIDECRLVDVGTYWMRMRLSVKFCEDVLLLQRCQKFSENGSYHR